MPENVLIISFYYPPYTGIEGNRIHSWANSLAADGFNVTVITRQWKAGGQNTWEDYFSEYHENDELVEEVTNNLRVIRLPYLWNPGFKKFQSTKLTGIYYWYSKLIGILHPETDAYHAFCKYADNYIQKNPVDFVIVSSPPLNIIKLGHDLKKKHKIRFIADFRDSFNNRLMQQGHKLSLKERAEAIFFRWHIRRWLRNADGVTSVSKAVLDTINKKFTQPTALVMNGFEKDLFNDINVADDSEKFRISMVGNLYPQQDIAFMARGIKAFLDKVRPTNLVVQFIGIKWKSNVVKEIRKYIPDEYLYFSDRVARTEAVSIMRNSQVLLQVGWKGYLGFCPGKVFEYMAAKKNILIAPADGDLTDRIIKETGTGYSAKSLEEVSAYLEKLYSEWKQTGEISYNGNPSLIHQYTRENQNLILSGFLLGFNQSDHKKTGHALLRASDCSN
jgi:glycosyltransferase involved in cell wall biosynthesis